MNSLSPVLRFNLPAIVSSVLLIVYSLGDTASFADEVRFLRGVVVDSNGDPIAGARITSTAPVPDAKNGRYETDNDLVTDQRGGFEASIHHGVRWLSISHDDYVADTFEIPRASKSLDEVRIGLGKQFRLGGIITDFRGKPIDNASVRAVSSVPSEAVFEVFSDSSGVFDFGDHDILPVTLVVAAASYSPQSVRIDSAEDRTDVSLKLLPGRKLRFRVVDEMDRPVAKVRVRSNSWTMKNGVKLDRGLKLASRTNQDGVCEFSGMPSGEVTFEFFGNDHQTAIETFSASPKTHRVKLSTRLNEGLIDVDPTDSQHRLFHLFKPDGTVIRPLLKDAEFSHLYGRQGTATICSDGTKIAFDAHRLGVGEDWSDDRIIVADIDGSNAKVISDGVIPALSPDGSHVAFSRARKFGEPEGASGQSIWIMNVDGADKQMIDDSFAWGVRWTSDGRSLVYRGGTDDDGNSVASNVLRTYDLATGNKHNVWEPEESPFSSLRFHFNVSRRGRLAVVAGSRKDTGRPAIAVLDLDKGLSSMRFLKMKDPSVSIGGVMDFTPGNRSILMAARIDGRVQPIQISIQGEAIATGILNLPSDVAIRDPLMPPNGEHVIATISSVP